MKTLRPHQALAIDMLRASLRSGKRRPVLSAAVGFGKTLVAATIARNMLDRDLRVMFVADAIMLIDQTVKAFWAEGITDIGVIQANHELTDNRRKCQIASVQTLQRRPRIEHKPKVVIIDECHARSKFLLELMAHPDWQDVIFIGLTATPWAKGMGNHYDDLLIPCTMRELIETINPDTGRPYLSPYRVFAPHNPDLSKVKTVAGEYHEGELSTVMSDEGLIADIVDTWMAKGERLPTLAFCVDRAHAAKVQARFIAAGVPWGYIDGFTETDERMAIRKQFDRREIFGVSSVGTMIKGVDWAIGCIIDAAPTKSEMRHVQKIGRGLRINEGLGDLILLDHAGNCLRLGFPCSIHKTELCTKQLGEKSDPPANEEPLPRKCAKCDFLMPPKMRACPACGFQAEKVSKVEEQEGELVEMRPRKAKGAQPADKQQFYAECKWYAVETGKKPSFPDAMHMARYGHWPARKHDVAPVVATAETMSYIRSRQIAYAKGKAKRA